MGFNCPIDDAKCSVVDKSAFSDSLSETAWTHTQLLVCWYVVVQFGHSLRGGYSSGCSENAEQPTEKEFVLHHTK